MSGVERIPLPENGLQDVRKIAEILRDAGGRAMLVGGCVRDLLLGREAKDFDLEVYGLDAETVRRAVERDYPLDAVGMSFGVMKVRHLPIDIALPRRESKTGAGHRGFLVDTVPDLSFADAAARRDFTVNAILCDPLTGEIVDPWGGREDLKQGILRHVSEHFVEDPLRVLRGMQFVARFGFTPAPETAAVSARLSQEELAPERIGTEWDKLLLHGTYIADGLRFLRAAKWLGFYPELAKLPLPEWEAKLAALDRFAGKRCGDEPDDRVLGAAVLCAGLPEADVLSLLKRVWRRGDLLERVPPLVSRSDAPCDETVADGALRRLALAVRRPDLLADLAECVSPERAAEIARFRARSAALGIEKTPPMPILQGRHLLERGFAAGPEMGAVLERCFDAQLDGTFADLDGALAFLAELRREKD